MQVLLFCVGGDMNKLDGSSLDSAQSAAYDDLDFDGSAVPQGTTSFCPTPQKSLSNHDTYSTALYNFVQL